MNYLEKLNDKVDKLMTLSLEQSVIIKQLIASQPGTQAEWAKRLRIPWRRKGDVFHVFNDAEHEALFTCYVRQFVQSGKVVDFHKNFFNKLMTRDLFRQSFLEASGHNTMVSYGVAMFVLPEGVLKTFWDEVERRPELRSLINYFNEKLRRMVNNEKNEFRLDMRRTLLAYYTHDAHSLKGKLASVVLCNDVLQLKVIDEAIDWSNKEGMRAALHKWRSSVNAKFKEVYPTKAQRDTACMKVLKPPRTKSGGLNSMSSFGPDPDDEEESSE